MALNWRDIKTNADRESYFSEQEESAVMMAGIARDIWKDLSACNDWLVEANRYRLLRWPKDRQFQPLLLNQ